MLGDGRQVACMNQGARYSSGDQPTPICLWHREAVQCRDLTLEPGSGMAASPASTFSCANRDNTRTPSRGLARTKQDKWSLIHSHFSEVLLILVLWPAVCCQSREAVLRAGGSSWWARQEALGPVLEPHSQEFWPKGVLKPTWPGPSCTSFRGQSPEALILQGATTTPSMSLDNLLTG